jgi:cell division transport system permease protein
MTEKDVKIGADLESIWIETSALTQVSASTKVVQCLKQFFVNVRRSAMTSLLTALTIGVAVSIMGILMIGLHNASSTIAGNARDLAVLVFFKDSATATDVSGVQSMVRETGVAASMGVVDKAMALERFRASLGEDASVLDGFEDDNPLPLSLHITLGSLSDVEAVFSALKRQVAGEPYIDAIRYSESDADYLRGLLSSVEALGLIALGVLGVLSSFVIANTIKLALVGHRLEIDIMRLIGANRRAIFAPFLLEGLAQGLVGAGLSLAVLRLGVLVMRNVIPEIEALAEFLPHVHFMPFNQALILMGFGAVVGFAGSFIAVRRFATEVQFQG